MKSSVMQNGFLECVLTLNKLVHTFVLDSPLKIYNLSAQFSQLFSHNILLFIKTLDLRRL